MVRRILILCLSTLLVASALAQEHRDLYFEESFFHAHQGDYFNALRRLDTELKQHHDVDEPVLDKLHYRIGEAQFSVGDFELSYRMHLRAGRAIKAVLEGDVSAPIRNEAAFRLARIHFQKGQMQDALDALNRMQGAMPDGVKDESTFLRANVYLAQGRPAEAAELLGGFSGDDDLKGFVAYNLGVALWRSGDRKRAFRQLSVAGSVKSEHPAQIAIRDKTNLVLGSLLLDENEAEASVSALQRVRLTSPFANQALLSSGWANANSGRYENAVVAWDVLARRDPTQMAVQEARLALPYAYSQMQIHGRAAVLYSQALGTFESEIAKLDASIESIRGGHFLDALVRQEIRQNPDWAVRLRELSQSPETYYLTELLASHAFQTALNNYLDLEELKSKLEVWQVDHVAYQDLLSAREDYYTPLLPGIDSKFRALDSRMRLRQQQAQLIERRMRELLTTPRSEVLATSNEAVAFARLQSISQQLEGRDDAHEYQARIDRLKGVLIWQTKTTYHERLTDLYTHLEELRDELDRLDERYAQFVRSRQAAEHSFHGYKVPLKRLSGQVTGRLETVERLMKLHGRQLENVAVAELERRHARLEEFQNTARFAMADSYDRATKTLQGASE